MDDWVKVGTDLVVGAVPGVADQLVQNWDDKREMEKGEKLPIMQLGGTYLNYGLPLLAVIGVGAGVLKGDWATRAMLLGGVLAGRKATWQITKSDRVFTYDVWSKEPAAKEPVTKESARMRGSILEF